MADVFVGSHEASQRNRGQAQDQTGVTTREKSLPIIPKVAPPNASTPNANASDDAKRLGEIQGHAVAAHPGMSPRVSDERVPAANVRKSRTDGVARPTR
jgi:hypothetical protein